MFGHQLLKSLSASHEVRATLHGPLARYASSGLFTSANSYDGIDAAKPGDLRRAIQAFEPEAVVNCIGIVKQSPLGENPVPSILINSLEPHVAAEACVEVGARLVHLSTDCVFAGTRGNYSESEIPDCTDLYGRSKLLGEVATGKAMTLRTSMIGFELSRKTGLLEWVVAQKGKKANGFRRAVFSGFSTPELSRIVERLLVSYPEAAGLYHVSTAPINKYDLLGLINEKMKLGIEIVPNDTYAIDRSLDSARFRQEFAYEPPAWEAMIEELAEQYRGGSGR